jgi:hypothetical protein
VDSFCSRACRCHNMYMFVWPPAHARLACLGAGSLVDLPNTKARLTLEWAMRNQNLFQGQTLCRAVQGRTMGAGAPSNVRKAPCACPPRPASPLHKKPPAPVPNNRRARSRPPICALLVARGGDAPSLHMRTGRNTIRCRTAPGTHNRGRPAGIGASGMPSHCAVCGPRGAPCPAWRTCSHPRAATCVRQIRVAAGRAHARTAALPCLRCLTGPYQAATWAQRRVRLPPSSACELRAAIMGRACAAPPRLGPPRRYPRPRSLAAPSPLATQHQLQPR